MAPEIVIGRSLAFCMYPFAAWRLLPTSGRILIVAAYAVAGYVAGLAVLLLA